MSHISLDLIYKNVLNYGKDSRTKSTAILLIPFFNFKVFDNKDYSK